LLEYAADEFSGLRAQSDGATVNQHNQSLIDQGFLPKQEAKEAPKELEYILQLHKEIRFSRIPPDKLAPLIDGLPVHRLIPREPITFSDLNQYQQLTNFKLSAIESSTILSIDGIYNNSTG